MKVVSFVRNGKSSYGVVVNDGIVDMGAKLGSKYPDLVAVLKAGALAEVEAAAKGAAADLPYEGTTLLPVIPNPGKIVCVGVNYDEHRREMGREPPGHPTIFVRFPESQVAHNQPLLKPAESDKLDYEAELAVIIGKRGYKVSEDDAFSIVAGYACYNDGSVRDWQTHTGQFTPGKNFNATGGFGPWMVTADEIPDAQKLAIQSRLNGQVMQSSNTDLMTFNIRKIIKYVTTFTPLEPGDVIATGTPGGVGTKRNPPVYMKDGDIIEIEIEKVGLLRNPVKNG
ncbi:fumarylacetoacetate hydrolase family protein [Ferrovibrio terrae]|uniref:Fumarylacetoacetate hydrolase family protein n=1 Tax=Ferrovibrio terrae TaxID=2594003 RepID=A0A516GZ14_9PROT|nr:fumarylacetoacetate hydrolase family protein [Ferrovibrio terrae]QDO96773.1 fumarylacetoacetate hydrolase family protein [Ferrovibrio terrae]